MTCFVEKAILAQVIINGNVMVDQKNDGIEAIRYRLCDINEGILAYIVHNNLFRKA